MSGMNSAMAPGIDTVFLPASPGVRHITGTLVRQIALMGGDVSLFVSPAVAARLRLKVTGQGAHDEASQRPATTIRRRPDSSRRPHKPRCSNQRSAQVIRFAMSVTLALMAIGAARAESPDPNNTLVIELKSGRVLIKLRPDLAPKHVARVKQLANDGVGPAKIARELGMVRSSVNRLLEEAGR